MKILLVGHAPWKPTGYGVPMIPICEAIEKGGHEVDILAIEAEYGAMEYKGRVVYFSGKGDLYGRGIIKEIVARAKIELIISIFDAWTIPPSGYSEDVSGVPWISWGPIEAHPMPNSQEGVLIHAHEIWTWSKYGHDLIYREYPELSGRTRLVPLSVDTHNFKIPRIKQRKEMRDEFGISADDTVFLFAGANRFLGDRKCVLENARAFAMLASRLPSVKLLVHTESNGFVNLPPLLYELGVSSQVMYIPKKVRALEFWEHRNMRHLYWAADCLLHASAAEGFGLQILEAMACGLPVIATDNSAMTELIIPGDNGELVKPKNRIWSKFGSWWERPDADGIFIAMTRFMDTNYDPKLVRVKALNYTEMDLEKNLTAILSEVSYEITNRVPLAQ